MNNTLKSLLLLALIYSSCVCFRLSTLMTKKMILHSNVNPTSNDEIFHKWYNKTYNFKEIDDWWIEVGKPLLTIGVKGVAPSQANSLKELLTQHKRVRVKLANNRMDPQIIVDSLLSYEFLTNLEVLQIRKREIMFTSK